MSLLGANGQPVQKEKEVVEIECGGAKLVVFKHPTDSSPLLPVAGQETEVFIAAIQRLNAMGNYMHAMVREIAALRSRIEGLEELASPDGALGFSGAGKFRA